jgi:hypothetical protein
VQKRTPKKKAAATLASLDSLAAELDAAAAAAGASSASASSKQRLAKGTKSSIKRSKARLAVGVAEGQRLHRVMAHPAYRADPIAAITNHLMTTMPAVAVGATGAAGAGTVKQQQQRKKTRKGGGGGGVAMQS